jgi:ketosteroid isomerase-like protein
MEAWGESATVGGGAGTGAGAGAAAARGSSVGVEQDASMQPKARIDERRLMFTKTLPSPCFRKSVCLMTLECEAEACELPNMKKKMLAGWMLAMACCLMACANASPTPADEQAVAQVLRQMYVALTQEDLAGLHAVTTADFYVFDVGRQMTGDELMALIKRLHAAGKTLVWTVTEPTVRIAGGVAWITYLNRGHVQDAAGKNDVSWLESAVLLKEGGAWRIQFFHSTRVPAE